VVWSLRERDATFWAGCWTHSVHYPAHNERSGSPPPSLTATNAERPRRRNALRAMSATAPPYAETGTPASAARAGGGSFS
jgi:hypothetical protein